METSPEQIEEAICQFYADPTSKSDLNAWLTQVQHSTQAWKFAWLLLSKGKSEEVQFFAGNTIYIKVSRCWHEVPKEDYESLKLKLLNCIVEYSSSRPILNRLIKAIAAYILHTIEEEWKSALIDIVNMFNPDNFTTLEPCVSLHLLFSILMTIPDELDNCQDRMGIRNANKQSIKNILRNNSDVVLKLCHQVMQASQISNVTKEIVLKTLNSWLQQISLPLADSKELLVSLIPYTNYGLLCEWVLECLRSASTDSHTHSYPATVMSFISELLSLRPVLDEANRAEDENTSSLIYSLFTSVVEAHSRLLLKSALDDAQRQTVIQVVSMLVECAGTPGQYPTQESLSSIPFAVWYTIQDDILTFEKEQTTELKLLFKPVYLKLVEIFIVKSLIPPEGVLNADEKELFRCYRQDICDTFMYAHSVLNEDMLSCLENHLKDGVSRMQTNTNDWRYLEAVLHAYSSIAETVADTDNYFIPRFIQSIPQIPFGDNMQLISVALTTLGAYADWLNFHQDHLQHVVPLMVAGLVNKNLTGAASQALRDLTLECPLTIAPFSLPILESCQKVLLNNAKIDSAETERIVTILSRVLSVGGDQQAVMNYLETTLTPFISRITHLKDKLDTYISVDEERELVSLLKLLGCLSRHLNLNNCPQDDDEETAGSHSNKFAEIRTQPLLLVLQPLMPILSSVAEKGSNRPEVAEALCKMLKNSISTLRDSCLPILPSILDIIPKLYQIALNSCVLEVVKQMCILFGREESHKMTMSVLLRMIVESTLSRASSNLWKHTDVLHEFHILMASTIKKVPYLLSVDYLPSIFSLGMESLKLPEEGTVKAASSFLSSFIAFSRAAGEKRFQLVVTHNIENLLRIVCYCICTSPRHNLNSYSDVLNSLSKLYGDDLVQSFKIMHSDQSFPSPRLTAQQKEEFVKKVLRNRGNKRNVLEAVTDLALLSRGIAGTEYGSQTRGYL